MKVVVFTRKNNLSCFMVNKLDFKHDYTVILEGDDTKEVLIRRFKRNIRKKGIVLGLLEFGKFISEAPFLLKENAKYNDYLKKLIKTNDYRPEIKQIEVDSINNPKVIRLVNEERPNLILVNGTRIISKQIIDSVTETGIKIINWHAGITPEYRGSKSEFYCIINKEFDKVGSTLHNVDSGIDTGDIVMQETINVVDEDFKKEHIHAHLRYKNARLAVEMSNRLMDNIENNVLNPIKKASKSSKLYSTPRRIHYKQYYEIIKNLNRKFIYEESVDYSLLFSSSWWGGVQRTVKFVKYLNKYGYEPIVFTVGNQNHADKDYSLGKDIPKGTKVYRGSDRNLKNYFNKYVTVKVLQKIFEILYYLMTIPDEQVGWFRNNKKKIEKIVKNENINIIYTSASPYSSNYFGLHLKQKFPSIKWIADFRDAWITNPGRFLNLILRFVFFFRNK